MAAADTLREIVRNGSDLTLTRGIAYDLLHELAATARQSGAKLTVTTALPVNTIRELSQQYGRSIAFIDGLGDLVNSDLRELRR